jgi:hypothetical protein
VKKILTAQRPDHLIHALAPSFLSSTVLKRHAAADAFRCEGELVKNVSALE